MPIFIIAISYTNWNFYRTALVFLILTAPGTINILGSPSKSDSRTILLITEHVVAKYSNVNDIRYRIK